METETAHVKARSGTIEIEQRAIDHVPVSERHGRARDLLTLWFASNMQINAVVTGGLAILIGLDVKWAIISILVGNLLGGLFMAYHSAQGPRLGLAQMIQTRAQFGMWGSLLPMLVTAMMYLGFFVIGTIVVGQTLATLLHIPLWAGEIILIAVTLVLATVGYDLIHAAGRWLSIVALVAFVAIFVKLLTIGVPGDFKGSAVNYGTVLLVISIAASWQIAWAPYVSDYSRYLPADTTTSRTFWFTYLGSAVGASWCMIVGTLSCAIGADAYLANPSGYLADLFPTVSWLLSLVIFLTILPAQAESPYGCFLTLFAGLSVTGKTRSAPRARALFVLGFCIIGALLAIVAGSHIFTTLENFALFMLYLLVPWTSINLTDYYFVRHGSYRINDFFNPQGVFGMVRWETVIIYLAVIAIEIPFINTGLYVGPMVAKLGGADISWILGLIVGAGAYYLVAKWRGLGPMLESQPSEA